MMSENNAVISEAMKPVFIRNMLNYTDLAKPCKEFLLFSNVPLRWSVLNRIHTLEWLF